MARWQLEPPSISPGLALPASFRGSWFSTFSLDLVLVTCHPHSHRWWLCPRRSLSPSCLPAAPERPSWHRLAWETTSLVQMLLKRGGSRVGGVLQGQGSASRSPREHPALSGRRPDEGLLPPEGLVLLLCPWSLLQALRLCAHPCPCAARLRRQPHEALHLHAGPPAPPCGSSLQCRPGTCSSQPGRPPPPPPLPSPQGQEAEVPGQGAQPVCRHGRCV